MNERRNLILNIIALVCAVWFISAGWVWVYFFCLVFAYPVGLTGLILWAFSRKTEKYKRLSRLVLGLLIAGLIVSLASIFLYR